MSDLQPRLEEQRDQARRDLDELTEQQAAGEIDEETAGRLRATYQAELEDAERRLTELAPEPEAAASEGRSPRRMVLGAVLIVGAFAGTLVLAGQFVQSRNDALQGVAAPATGTTFDPSKYSDETLEAVVAANAENPQINGMRYALANRYFQKGEYQKAFPHYQKILDSNPSPQLAAAVLARLGWMVYQGNGDVTLATSLLDRSLALVPDDPLALLFDARVRWCGAGKPDEAVPLLQKILAMPNLDPSVQSQVEQDLATARAGGACP